MKKSVKFLIKGFTFLFLWNNIIRYELSLYVLSLALRQLLWRYVTLALRQLLWRYVSYFGVTLRWRYVTLALRYVGVTSNHLVNLVDKTKYSFPFLHRRSTKNSFFTEKITLLFLCVWDYWHWLDQPRSQGLLFLPRYLEGGREHPGNEVVVRFKKKKLRMVAWSRVCACSIMRSFWGHSGKMNTHAPQICDSSVNRLRMLHFNRQIHTCYHNIFFVE